MQIIARIYLICIEGCIFKIRTGYILKASFYFKGSIKKKTTYVYYFEIYI